MIVKQIIEGRAEVENQYGRVVERDGNRKALGVLSEVFEPRDFFEWRGLGSIAHSGMKLKSKYAKFDAELKFDVPGLLITISEDSRKLRVVPAQNQPPPMFEYKHN